jgi:xylan 1,4-beta-xylosidase
MPEQVLINLDGPTTEFPHFWEQMFGSGRAILSLRSDYRSDLHAIHAATDLKYVRFHAIFHDEVGLYGEDAQGQPIYNFSYVDQIYDGLLAEHVKPFVELSFMPAKLASTPAALHPFWYKPNTSPPKDWAKWDAMISAFVKHLIDRYGVDEVRSWYFEVWNEPNLDFWSGEPRQQSYWKLYDHTARAVKSVDSRLRVGGPATAQSAWVDAFIAHCAANNVPLDFVSTHVYGDDRSQDVFGTREEIPRREMVCRAVKKVHDQIAASSMPRLPLIWSEFNATYRNLPEITDSTFMGPWLADTIRQCNGMVTMMSYWTFSDVFEEQGVVKTPFYGGYGLIAERGIPKPAYNAFLILHHLGKQRIAVSSDSVLATRRDDGTYAIAIWNYADPDKPGKLRMLKLSFTGKDAGHALIYRVDDNHGNALKAYSKMGSPSYPTESQIRDLQEAAELPQPDEVTIRDQELMISIPPHGLALIEIR